MLSLQPGFKYPFPDWDHAQKEAEVTCKTSREIHDFWTQRGRHWSRMIGDSLGEKYVLVESPNFWFVSSQDAATNRRLINWAEQVHARLLKALGNLVGELYGKVPVIVTADEETYYDYVAQYYSDGEHALSGGVFLNQGYGHFVFCYRSLGEVEPIIAHELTHSLLMALPLPLWLNEGIAQLAEIAITGRYAGDTDRIKETLASFWNATTIQELWDGRSFNRQDEGQLQSYHLSLVLTRKLTGNMEKFRQFACEASYEDAGDSSLRKHYGLGLGDLVADYLGEGNWEPNLPDKPPEVGRDCAAERPDGM